MQQTKVVSGRRQHIYNMLALWEFEHNAGELFVAWTIRTVVGRFVPCCPSDD